MFLVTRYQMISKTESGRVGYHKKYWVAGRVRVPAEHCINPDYNTNQEILVIGGKGRPQWKKNIFWPFSKKCIFGQ